MTPKPELNAFKEWQDHPVTQWMFEQIDHMRQQYARATGEGATYDPASLNFTAMKTAEAVGFNDGLNALQNIKIAEEQQTNERNPYRASRPNRARTDREENTGRNFDT